MGLAESKAQIKLSDVPRVSTTISPARLPDPEEAALYSRALFTPEEVSNLKTRFQKMDFVSVWLFSFRSFSGRVVDEKYPFFFK